MSNANFLSWWLTELRGLAPAPRLILVAHSLDPAAFDFRQASGEAPTACVLRLPPGLLLTCNATLPLAAEREAARVLGYEMDRFTPFQAHELIWHWRPLRRDRTADKLHLALSYLPKATVAPLLAALTAAGIAPVALESDGQRLTLTQAASPRRRSTGLLLAFGAALALLVVAEPFLLQESLGRKLERRTARLRPAAFEAEALQRRLRDRGTDVAAAAALQRRSGDALEVLAALTRTLPDDTYLTDLSLREGTLSLQGQSASAARLIGLLSANPVIDDPAFAAPVTRGAGGQGELFSIRARVVSAASSDGSP